MPTTIQSQSSRKPHLYLKEWRQHRQLTQEQAAERVSSTKATISRYERGRREPDEAMKAALAYAYGCEVQDLYRLPQELTAEALLRGKPPEEQKRILSILEAILKAS